jgi:aminoglycoside 3-N-acetyltransferase
MQAFSRFSSLTKGLVRVAKNEGVGFAFESTFSWIVDQYIQKKFASSKLVLSSASLEGILNFLREAGVGEGSSIFLHSAWDPLKGCVHSPMDLITAVEDLIGESGTLAMPAFPEQIHENDRVFDVDRAPSRAGWVTEVYRRLPGVLRSANVNHSVIARGPAASFLVDSHHLSTTSWDEKSPYFRIGQLPDSWIIGIGAGKSLIYVTSLHCAESALVTHPYFRKVFGNNIRYSYKSLRFGFGKSSYARRLGVTYPPKLAKHFGDKLNEATIDGLDIFAIRANDLIEGTISLAKRGKTMYLLPIPWPWLFRAN